jgi:hypothetical protein
MPSPARPDDALALMLDDLRALRTALTTACELHAREESVAINEPATSLVTRLRDLLLRHNTQGETLHASLQPTPGLQNSADAAGSAHIADFFLRVRKPRRSLILRDLSTLLNLAAADLSILHSAALAMRQEELARLALYQLAELTPLIIEISRLLPSAAVSDLASTSVVADPLAADTAEANIHEAWQTESVRRP